MHWHGMIGWCTHLKQWPCLNLWSHSPFPDIWEKSITLHDTLAYCISVLPYHLNYHRTLPNMNTLPSGNGGPSLIRDPYKYGISNTRTENNTSNIIRGDSNHIIGNVSNSHNRISVRISEKSSRIQPRWSPLEPHARHQDVRNRRLDGVGDWVLEKNEFKSWRMSQDGSGNPTLLCYGDQGTGKTYIRYQGIFRGR